MDTPNPARDYFERRARADRITARSHRGPKVRAIPRPGWAAARTEAVIPKTDWRAIADREARIAGAELRAKANARAHDARQRITTFLARPGWAVRMSAEQREAFVFKYSRKSAMYKAIVRCVVEGMSPAASLRFWPPDAGEPPSVDDLAMSVREFQRSL